MSHETWAAARDLLSGPASRSNPGALAKSLLSGVAACGVHGATMKAGVVRYIQGYRSGLSPYLARKRADADDNIAEVVTERLSRPDAIDLLVDRCGRRARANLNRATELGDRLALRRPSLPWH